MIRGWKSCCKSVVKVAQQVRTADDQPCLTMMAMFLSLLLASASSARAYKPSQRLSVGLWPMPVSVRAARCA
jgi:hypothetical protein|eukprot:COSAG06_NODE_35496_length_459_cov_1.227778_1_plen_72_part_10